MKRSYSFRSGLTVLAIILIPSWSYGQSQVYQATDPEPTPQETLLVEYINRFRADPKADAARILPILKKQKSSFFKVDVRMFQKEVEKMPARAPVVFNLKLLDSARKHAHYQIINNYQGHDQIPGQPGFTGKNVADRQKAVGYKRHYGENCFVYATSAWHAHMAFIVDWGAGPGGMLTKRGHRMLNGDIRVKEVAVGMLKKKNGQWAVVQHFGMGDRKRYVGGVVYIDRNKNGFYDIGEGVGGVNIKASDGSSMKTWKSGAYGMALKRRGSVSISATINGKTHSQQFKSGRENIKFDWVIKAEGQGQETD